MKQMNNNIVIVMLVLTAFIAQAMASTAMSYSGVSCVHGTMMSKMSDSTMSDSTISDNTMPDSSMSKMNMALTDSEQDSDMNMSMDCCEDECKCPMNGCVSLSFLLNTYTSTIIVAEQKILQLSSSHQSQSSASLYRPPIS